MVDIQTGTAEIRQGKKKKPQGKNIMAPVTEVVVATATVGKSATKAEHTLHFILFTCYATT